MSELCKGCPHHNSKGDPHKDSAGPLVEEACDLLGLDSLSYESNVGLAAQVCLYMQSFIELAGQQVEMQQEVPNDPI